MNFSTSATKQASADVEREFQHQIQKLERWLRVFKPTWCNCSGCGTGKWPWRHYVPQPAIALGQNVGAAFRRERPRATKSAFADLICPGNKT